MRVRDFAAAIGVDPSQALATIASLGMPNAPTHANSGIPEDVYAKLAVMYPQLAGVDTADSPEVGEEVAAAAVAPVSPQAETSPTPAPAAPAPVTPPPRPSSPLNVVPQSAAPQDNGDPAARSEVARQAVERQYIPQPERRMRKYEVSYPGAETLAVDAMDANEAWAKYNDRLQKSYAPRLRRVVELTPEMVAARQQAALAAAQAAAGTAVPIQ